MSDPLPPEIVAAIDKALSDLESSIPGVSRDTQVRSQVEAAVSVGIDSLERRVTAAMEAEMGDLRSVSESGARSMIKDFPLMGDTPAAAVAVYEAAEATRRTLDVFELAEATRQALEKADPATVTE